jgi:hypothetical protein
MQFPQSFPILTPIGHDFRDVVSNSAAWIQSGKYIPIAYPPITRILYAPFTFLSYDTGYKILLVLVLLCYVFITLILPQRIHQSKVISGLAMLIFITGLVSYGLQLELERGQENVLAFTFCLTAIFLFHYSSRQRWLAYLLFSISVQLKLYPAIFVFTLIDNWRDWKNNIKRFAGLGAVNIAILFIFGLGPVLSMLHNMTYVETTYSKQPYNLSISAFVSRILSLDFLPQNQQILLWLQANSWLLQFFFLAFFVVCFAIILRQAYKKNAKGLNPFIFLACTIGACIIPGISFDYKLSLLPASVMLFIPVLQAYEHDENKLSVIVLTFLFSTAYSSMLYSYVNKPKILQYNFPALLVLLIICTIISYATTGETLLTAPLGKS